MYRKKYHAHPAFSKYTTHTFLSPFNVKEILENGIFIHFFIIIYLFFFFAKVAISLSSLCVARVNMNCFIAPSKYWYILLFWWCDLWKREELIGSRKDPAGYHSKKNWPHARKGPQCLFSGMTLPQVTVQNQTQPAMMSSISLDKIWRHLGGALGWHGHDQQTSGRTWNF